MSTGLPFSHLGQRYPGAGVRRWAPALAGDGWASSTSLLGETLTVTERLGKSKVWEARLGRGGGVVRMGSHLLPAVEELAA